MKRHCDALLGSRDLLECKTLFLNLQTWTDLEQLLEVLEPIREHIKISESKNSTLGSVLQRWMNIQTHLAGVMRSQTPCAAAIMPYLSNESFSNRMELHTDFLHALAYYLLPENQRVTLSATHQTKIVQCRSPDQDCPSSARTAW
jgi:hypothetical protein